MDELLSNFDVGVAGATYRALLGATLAWLLPDASVPEAALVLAFALFLLKAVASALRRVVPASEEVRALWTRRRVLAGRFDSYQWRKLLWVGLGLLAGSRGRGGWAVLGGVCIGCGAVAQVIWHRSRVAKPPAPGPA